MFWLCFIFFSVHQIFDVPVPIFAKLCHTTLYVATDFGLHYNTKIP